MRRERGTRSHTAFSEKKKYWNLMKRLEREMYYNQEGVRADSSQRESPSNISTTFTSPGCEKCSGTAETWSHLEVMPRPSETNLAGTGESKASEISQLIVRWHRAFSCVDSLFNL